MKHLHQMNRKAYNPALHCCKGMHKEGREWQRRYERDSQQSLPLRYSKSVKEASGIDDKVSYLDKKLKGEWKSRGVKDYAALEAIVYCSALGTSSEKLKEKYGLYHYERLRDHLSAPELIRCWPQKKSRH